MSDIESELPEEGPRQTTLEEDEATLREVLIKIGLTLLVFLSLFAGLVYTLKEPLTQFSAMFVEVFGPLGVFLGWFLPDGLTVPMPNDAFLMFGIQGGLGFWQVVSLATAGTLSGGMVGYGIGTRLQHTRWFRRLMSRRGAEIHSLVRRYGLLALALATLTPLPYSLACWASGALEIPFRHFCLVSLLRIPRIIGFLWLIQEGFVSLPTV